MLKRHLLLSLLAAAPAFADSPANVLWVPFSHSYSLDYVRRDLSRDGRGEPVVTQPPLSRDRSGLNPLLIAPVDFQVGASRPFPLDEGATSEVPAIRPEDAKWFEQLNAAGRSPQVFVVAGHNVISEGFHDIPEDNFLFVPSFLDTLARFPSARQAFDSVRLAILWGCNTLTNLEPHGPSGEFLTPAQIRAQYDSGPAGRREVVGAAGLNNTLEFYKSRLARAYGPQSAHYEYTRSADAERCRGPGRYEGCVVANLERIMPEHGLYDGSHMYNAPHLMKRVFRSANLVLGWTSASPSEHVRVKILEDAVTRTYREVPEVRSVFGAIIADETPRELRIKVIEALRRQWTKATLRATSLPSGSITPALPELDAAGVFNVDVRSRDPRYIGPVYAPYEARD